MTVMKQSMKSQANTQDSLRVAVSHLDKQVQVLPSTLAKQLAQPAELHEALPKPTSEAEAAEQHQKQRAQLPDVSEKQLTQWSEALDEQPEADSVLAARAAFMRQSQPQQQQVPLSRQLIEEPPKPVAGPSPAAPSPKQPEQLQATTPEPVAPQVTIVQVCLAIHLCACCLKIAEGTA